MVLLHQPQAEAKQITFSADLEPALTVAGDPEQLKRVFQNLLSNALFYTDFGGWIKIFAHQVQTQVMIEVTDTGIGIAPENLAKIFDRFWRSDTSRSYHSGGAGIGLAIVQTIIQQHQGNITVESQVGVGSCFRVTFPSNSLKK